MILHGDIPADTPPFHVGAQLLRLLDRLESDSPVAIVVDDLQWTDRVSLQALGFALRRMGADAILTVFALRPDAEAVGPTDPSAPELHRMIGGQEKVVIHLSGLDQPEIAQLARAVLGNAVNAAIAERLWRHTQGHPLYAHTVIAESPRHLEEHRNTLPVPQSLTATVGRLLAAISGPARRIVEAASVLGSRAPLTVVGQVFGRPGRCLTCLAFNSQHVNPSASSR